MKLTPKVISNIFLFCLVLVLGIIVSYLKANEYNRLFEGVTTNTYETFHNIKGNHINISRQQHMGFIFFRDGLSYSLSKSHIRIERNFPRNIFYKKVTLNKNTIIGCSQSSYGKKDISSVLVIKKINAVISIRHSPEIIEWCWKNRIPVLSNKEVREWEYNAKPLPAKSELDKRLSKPIYDEYMNKAWKGF